MSGTRQGSTLALPLENQPRTEETEGTLVSGAAEMVTGQFGLIPLGRGPLGAGASEQQQAQRLKRRRVQVHHHLLRTRCQLGQLSGPVLWLWSYPPLGS